MNEPKPQRSRPAEWFRHRFPRTSAFLVRQSAPDAYPGLPQIVGLLVGLVALGIFGIMAESFKHHWPLEQLDQRLAADFADNANAGPTVANFFGVLTQMGGVPANIVLAVGIGLVLLVRGRRQLAIAAMLTALAGGLLLLSLKEAFQRDRPGSPGEWVTERNYSFPSGHSMGSVIGYGLLAYLLLLPMVQRRQARAAIIAGLCTLVVLIGFSRVYLRAHYVSDVVAGFAVGTVCLALFIVIHETTRRPRRRLAPATGAGPPAGDGAQTSSPLPVSGEKTL
jgi:undecaprenyl-diphosphatase